ncbi:MAG: glycosyltransferase family 4 protein [Actinomyces urogenitalis]|uniref:glycosyltransferase family 4 protein n=1 Tax=Actinomyces urogenitalis TaxID=103621 RepID=UPI002A81157E|nr:glycosyltransferase family 4 protein [Actinomyces urogenitalis]MDY3677851.1 glycosyltransferase family 4 protein [Actinomyces urogenitalis]
MTHRDKAGERSVSVPAPSPSSPTVLWYFPVSNLAGVARHAIDVAGAGALQARVVFLCPEGPAAAELRRRGARVVTGPVSPDDGPLRTIPYLRRLLKQVRPQILHTHLAYADISGALALLGLPGRRERSRLVSTEHCIPDVPGYFQRNRVDAVFKALVHRARLYRVDRLIAVAEYTRREVLRQWGAGAPITVIRNGVNPPEPVPVPQPGLRVLSLCRLAPEKKVDRVIRAFDLVRKEHPQARLTVAGAGELAGELQALARDLDLGDTISFPGHIDADAALRSHDVVVQLSEAENLSYSLLDTVVYRCGVVCTDVGGNDEIVPRWCIIDPTDESATARAIIEQGLDLGRRPQRDPRDLSVEEMCERISAVYREVVG